MAKAAPPGALLTGLRPHHLRDSGEQLLDLGPDGCETVATWLHRVRTATGPAQDHLLGALLTEARGGEVAAVDVLLQAMAPAVRRATAALPSLENLTQQDRAAAAVSASWEAIRCARTEPHTHVFITLLRDARRILAPTPTANQRHIADRTITVDTARLHALAGAAPEPTLPAEVRLAQLLAWARDTRILTAGEIDLLNRATIADEPTQHIADGLGISVAAVRKRVERIQTRLTAAVREQRPV